MNSDFLSDGHDGNKTIQNLKKTYRSHNEIEKRKILESNQFQHPRTIKQNLGEIFGGIVINLIPKDDLIRLMEEEKIPLHFEVTPKNMITGNIKLTPVDIDTDTTALNIETIMRIGDRLAADANKIIKDEQNEAFERKVEEMIRKKNKFLDEKIRPMEKARYEKNLAIVMDEFNRKLCKTKEAIKKDIMNKCKIELENDSIKIARCLKYNLKKSVEIQEKKMRNKFDYQMKLSRSELFNKFKDEKLEYETFWRKELKTIKEKNVSALKHLQVSLEAEHVKNLTELEQWYEIRNHQISVKKFENINTAQSNTNKT